MLSPDVSTELDKNKDLIRSRIEFSNTGFAGSLDDFISPNYIGHLGATTIDRNELERLERPFCMAFPDAHHAINDLIAEGDRVVLRTTARPDRVESPTHRAAVTASEPFAECVNVRSEPATARAYSRLRRTEDRGLSIGQCVRTQTTTSTPSA
jgi:SnoaL-like polyketide cyclase